MKRFDAPGILRKLAEVRELMPHVSRTINDEGAAASKSLRDFELQAVADALDGMASDLSRALEDVQAKLIADALEIYYAAEALARDPQHADLQPYVEAMRRAYENDFGCGIPARESLASRL